MENYRTSSHTRFDIKYHFVWITKYRKCVLRGAVASRCRELVIEICKANEIVANAMKLTHSTLEK